MQDSSTYQAIIAEGEARGEARGEAKGEAKGERQFLLRVGRKRFGEPDSVVRDVLDSITSAKRLEELADRLLEVESWHDLLHQ